MSSPHVIAIDQSTSASKVFLLDDVGRIVDQFSKSHKQYYPKPGFVEHDAEEIWQNVLEGIRQVIVSGLDIVGLAISNQRETTVFWDRATGQPLGKAIVWQDVRGEGICLELAEQAGLVQRTTGLKLSAYFPAAKAAAKFRDEPDLHKRALRREICVGTVDSYLIYRLSGGRVFATDVSNAGRTQLMDLNTLDFSEEMCDLFGIPMGCLPEIRHSDAGFGEVRVEGLPVVPIAAVLGDSHAALFGQGCHEKGSLKATFGTGSSVMMNIGATPLLSVSGLSTCVGYAFLGHVCYVLEGNVTSSGDTLKWLTEEAGLARDVAEVESISNVTPDTGGVYLVPAFSGLGAPHQQPQAQAIICGISRGSNREHIVRAALESIAYQDNDIIRAMEQDTGMKVTALRVDGGPSGNAVLMQFLSDISGCDVQTAPISQLSAQGAGIMALHALGVFKGSLKPGNGLLYTPRLGATWREDKLKGWQTALKRSIISE